MYTNALKWEDFSPNPLTFLTPASKPLPEMITKLPTRRPQNHLPSPMSSQIHPLPKMRTTPKPTHTTIYTPLNPQTTTLDTISWEYEKRNPSHEKRSPSHDDEIIRSLHRWRTVALILLGISTTVLVALLVILLVPLCQQITFVETTPALDSAPFTAPTSLGISDNMQADWKIIGSDLEHDNIPHQCSLASSSKNTGQISSLRSKPLEKEFSTTQQLERLFDQTPLLLRKGSSRLIYTERRE